MCWPGCLLDHTVVIVLAVGRGWSSLRGVQPGAVGAYEEELPDPRANLSSPAQYLRPHDRQCAVAQYEFWCRSRLVPSPRRIDQGPCREPRGKPGSIINLTDEAVQRDQGSGSLDKSAERKDLTPEVDIHQPDDLKRSVQAVVLHSDVSFTAAGADIAVRKPALPRPMR